MLNLPNSHHQPTTINHQPTTINHQPSTINHQPSTNNQQPPLLNPKGMSKESQRKVKGKYN